MSAYRAEIGIVGAGPAGARAAELLAAAGAEVLLLDPKAPWEKPCGGGLTAGLFDEVPELSELDGARRVGAARLEAPGASIQIPLDAPLTVICRIDLARWQLARAEAAGAVHLPWRVRRLGRLNDEWRLQTEAGEVRVRKLVGADGAASTVRRAVRPRFRPTLAPTRVVYPDLGGRADAEVLFRFVPGMDGYVWDFPRSDHRSVGAGVSGGAASRRVMDATVDAYWLEVAGDRLAGLPRAGAVIGTAGHPHVYSDVGGSDWALLGDAAGFADPVTGEGIRNAFRSAACLADAYGEDRTFGSYPARAEATFERGFRLSRGIHALLYDGDAAAWLVRAAAHSTTFRGLLAATANGGNEHQLRTRSLFGHWASAFRSRMAA